jgi:hypothetical protein
MVDASGVAWPGREGVRFSDQAMSVCRSCARSLQSTRVQPMREARELEPVLPSVGMRLPSFDEACFYVADALACAAGLSATSGSSSAKLTTHTSGISASISLRTKRRISG